jgi:four helix bundle protein
MEGIMPIRSHKELVVWQKAMDLAVEVYRVAEAFPKDETYRLTAQISRAVVSVPANIAEGAARDAVGDYARFLAIARGSLAEVETFLTLAVRFGYVDDDTVMPAMSLADEVGRMLTTLRRRLLQG